MSGTANGAAVGADAKLDRALLAIASVGGIYLFVHETVAGISGVIRCSTKMPCQSMKTSSVQILRL